jgi:hypothetical protein
LPPMTTNLSPGIKTSSGLAIKFQKEVWIPTPNIFLSTISRDRELNQKLHRGNNTCPPSLFQKHKGIRYFGAPAGARGQRRASRNHEAQVFPWDEAGPQAFRLSLRKPFWFRRGKQNARRCFRESRRRPRAQPKLSP